MNKILLRTFNGSAEVRKGIMLLKELSKINDYPLRCHISADCFPTLLQNDGDSLSGRCKMCCRNPTF
jgi:hypothetical protein